jgi:hypothetical protein
MKTGPRLLRHKKEKICLTSKQVVNCDEFKSDGLQQKLAVATLILGKYLIISLTTQDNLQNQPVP